MSCPLGGQRAVVAAVCYGAVVLLTLTGGNDGAFPSSFETASGAFQSGHPFTKAKLTK